MANFIVSYDLNGPRPSHKEVDEQLEKLGAGRGRILETVWYVAYSGTAKELLDHLKPIFGKEDLLFVTRCRNAAWTKLLVDDDDLLKSWAENDAS